MPEWSAAQGPNTRTWRIEAVPFIERDDIGIDIPDLLMT